MREQYAVNHKRFLADYRSLQDRAAAMVLVSLVATAGSTYRQAGARMLVTETGKMTGLVSGGCLEGGLLLEAKKVLASGQSRLIEIDMRAEEEGMWGLALGCSGLVKLHLQLLETDAGENLLDCIAECYRERQAGLAVTRLDEGGQCRWYFELGERRAGNLQLGATQQAELYAAAADANIVSLDSEGQRETYFVERIRPPFSLLLLGAGPDIVPVCELARTLGWHVQLVDRRTAPIQQARVAGADEAVRAVPAQLAAAIELDKVQAAVIMSHNLAADAEYLRVLLPGKIPYIGLLGPRYRGEALMECCGATLAEYAGRVFTPVGLALGGEGPACIALSIIAQIQAHACHRSGLPLAG